MRIHPSDAAGRAAVARASVAGVTLLGAPLTSAASLSLTYSGPAQGRMPAYGEHVYVEDLPEAMLRVLPTSCPDGARRAGVEGIVVAGALVCAGGRVMESRAVNSIPMLDGAAVQAVETWAFQPARTAGRPVAVRVAVPVEFSLRVPS